MPINTKKVHGRRNVRYESLDEFLNDAKRLAQSEVRTLGNWSQGQIYEHLARSLNSSIDGMGFSLAAPLRWMLTIFMKRKFLKKEIPAGFKSTDKFIPEKTSVEAGLASLENAIVRQQQETKRVPHPAFGNIGLEGWNDFHLRHAEMHMSFLVNGDQTEN
ncbi:MAG: DUF1569 domain-containing protein [Planctomycetaceae bacterium]